jgi:hypothetical protein
MRAAALRLRPSSIHAGIASGSVPAFRHSPAAWRFSGSSGSPSPARSRSPATPASRSATAGVVVATTPAAVRLTVGGQALIKSARADAVAGAVARCFGVPPCRMQQRCSECLAGRGSGDDGTSRILGDGRGRVGHRIGGHHLGRVTGLAGRYPAGRRQGHDHLDASGRDAGAHETQDACDGHPQGQGIYHYHTYSPCLSTKASQRPGSSTLVGYALDGGGIYLERDDHGNLPADADLDACQGRTSAITWDGKRVVMYHYDVTLEYPYTVGCYHGTPVSTHQAPGRPNAGATTVTMPRVQIPWAGRPESDLGQVRVSCTTECQGAAVRVGPV